MVSKALSEHGVAQIPAPSANLASGSFILHTVLGACLVEGRLNAENAVGDPIHVRFRGVVRVPAASATTFTKGDIVEIDVSADSAVANGAGDFDIGRVVEAKTAGQTSVLVDLNNQLEDLVAISLASFAVPLTDARVWDAMQTNIGSAGTDDLGLVTGTIGTHAPSLETGDVKASNTTRYCAFLLPVPSEYKAGEDLQIVVNAGMKTTVSGGTATVDLQVYRIAAPGTDICATAAQTINSLTAADKTFVLTDTDVVPGDVLLVRVAIAVNDPATATAVIGKINSITLNADVER